MHKRVVYTVGYSKSHYDRDHTSPVYIVHMYSYVIQVLYDMICRSRV